MHVQWESLANEHILGIEPYEPGKPLEELERPLVGERGPAHFSLRCRSMLSQAARISSVMSSSVALPFTGTLTTARPFGSPTKLQRSFHSRIM